MEILKTATMWTIARMARAGDSPQTIAKALNVEPQIIERLMSTTAFRQLTSAL